MQCRNCGAEIADKALICYRCGTPTSEAKYQAAPLGRRRLSLATVSPAILVIIAIAVAALAIYLWASMR